MKKFNGKNFLLTTKTAKHLYHDYAKKLPIIDYHCHLVPKEIYDDIKYDNITQLWLGADHYKWRQMRSCGISEKYITGDAPDREKFQKWAEIMPSLIGNPLYHWSHLELKMYFGYEGVLNAQTAQKVWDLCNEKLKDKSMSARNLIINSNVEVVCTTDDPVDDLIYHKKLKEEGFLVKVLPAWRPDMAMNIVSTEYSDYIKKLANVSGVDIKSFNDLIKALKIRMDYFESCGCVVSDHGLSYVMYEEYDEEVLDAIFNKAISGEEISKCEERIFITAFMINMGREYAKRNWVMQLHFGVQRDLNKKIFNKLGPNAGIDAIGDYTKATELGKFLNGLAIDDSLPKTILYSLNPVDNAYIGTVMGCFQDDTAKGKVQHGAAWWFNDHKYGMLDQLKSLASLGALGNFVGMLTDSRSFVSYARHDYFRRILCELIGQWVENGEYPDDDKSLKKIVEGISYYNCKEYFNF